MTDLRYVKGLDGVLDTLKNLPPEIVSKGGGPVRAALRKAGVVIQKAGQENIQAIIAEPSPDGRSSESTGVLEPALVVSRRKPRPGTKGEVYQIRYKRSVKYEDGTRAAKVGGILEFGDERIPPKAPLRRGFESSKGEALSTFTTEIRKRLDAAVRKARKKGLIA